eukprot:scaffold222611_cov40-Tisochrysis_lutea.AAC.1
MEEEGVKVKPPHSAKGEKPAHTHQRPGPQSGGGSLLAGSRPTTGRENERETMRRREEMITLDGVP